MLNKFKINYLCFFILKLANFWIFWHGVWLTVAVLITEILGFSVYYPCMRAEK
jgi:hypothetical protein